MKSNTYMNNTFVKVLVGCLMVFPTMVSAKEVIGTLDSFSIRAKSLIVDSVEYAVDIENLNITYNGAYMGADALERGLRVHLIIDDETAVDDDQITGMRILTYKPELDS